MQVASKPDSTTFLWQYQMGVAHTSKCDSNMTEVSDEKHLQTSSGLTGHLDFTLFYHIWQYITLFYIMCRYFTVVIYLVLPYFTLCIHLTYLIVFYSTLFHLICIGCFTALPNKPSMKSHLTMYDAGNLPTGERERVRERETHLHAAVISLTRTLSYPTG